MWQFVLDFNGKEQLGVVSRQTLFTGIKNIK
jgi:hypothetical protein